jgi:C-terminal processing protease CtpA/Prc
MKKVLLIGLPLAVLFLVGGYVFSQTEPGDRDSIHRHILENYSRAGFRLGVVLSENDSDQGVRIELVEPDSPADRAGIQEGDVITHLDGEKVISPRDVREFLRNLKEAKEVNIEVLRDGQPVTLSVTPEKRDQIMRGFRFGGRQIGVNVQSLDPDLASYFKVEPNSGLLISRVDREGPAAEAGVRSGDILTHIDGKRVSDPEDVRRMIGEGESETVELTILRHGNQMKMTVKPEEREMFGSENFPHLRELPRMLESPEFKSEMDNLRNEMDQLKRELQDLRREELDTLKDQIRQQLQQEMDKIRKELKDEKNKS